jgi:hypothetical protein
MLQGNDVTAPLLSCLMGASSVSTQHHRLGVDLSPHADCPAQHWAHDDGWLGRLLVGRGPGSGDEEPGAHHAWRRSTRPVGCSTV